MVKVAPATVATSVVDATQPFLRYQVPIIVTPDDWDALTSHGPRYDTGGASSTSLAASKLVAAKNASREAFLAAQGSAPSEAAPVPSAAASIPTPVAAAHVGRKDPTQRLPTPPVAGRRRAGNRPHLSNAALRSGGGGGDGMVSVFSTSPGSSSPVAAGGAPQVLPVLMRNLRDPSQVLFSIFPPKMVTMPGTGEAAVQRVSTARSSREDVVRLHEDVRTRLRACRARPDGICLIRRTIYEDLFNELIRQVALEEPARGVALQRVRDELQQTLGVHRCLLSGAEYFASRKLLTSGTGVTHLEQRMSQLLQEKSEMEGQRRTLEERRMQLERRIEEERVTRAHNFQEELAYLRRANQQLSLRLKTETERASATGGAAIPLDGCSGGMGGDA